MIGDGGVGKSSLLMRYCDEGFSERYVTTQELSVWSKESISLDEEMISLLISDFASLRKVAYIIFTNIHCTPTDGVIIVYDVTNIESFQLVQHCLEKYSRCAKDDLRKILVGNKCDLDTDRVVSYRTGKDLADKFGIPLIETSAKDSTNVEQLFISLTSEVRDTRTGVGSKDMTCARKNKGKPNRSSMREYMSETSCCLL